MQMSKGNEWPRRKSRVVMQPRQRPLGVDQVPNGFPGHVSEEDTDDDGIWTFIIVSPTDAARRATIGDGVYGIRSRKPHVIGVESEEQAQLGRVPDDVAAKMFKVMKRTGGGRLHGKIVDINPLRAVLILVAP